MSYVLKTTWNSDYCTVWLRMEPKRRIEGDPGTGKFTMRTEMRKETDEAMEKDWTVMAYMAGDSSLSSDMANALNDIRNAAADINSGVKGQPRGLLRWERGGCPGTLL